MIIGYCRKSRVSETDELDRQEHLVVEYCKNKGYKLDRLFSEVGSSVDPDRPQYKLMLQYLTEHEGVTVIVTDYDRIGRDTLLLSLFKQLCKEHKHLVELVNGTIYSYDNYTDIFTQEILSSVSSYIYQQTKAKMQRGLVQARKEGKRVGAKPFGYDIVNKRLAVNPVQADTVKRIFKLIAQGTSTAEVVRLLKQEGITTNTGRFFDTRAIRLLIKNIGYTGKKDENVYPAIISKELYLEANKQLRSVPNCGNKRSYALSGKIICSHCGSSLIIGYKADRGLPIVNSCNTSNSNRKGIYPSCSCQGVRLNILENLVLSDTSAYIENKLASMYNQLKSNEGVLQEHKKEMDSITFEITTNSKKLNKLNDLYLLDNITAEQLKEKSEAIKETIAMLTLKKRRVEGYSLYDKVALLQNEIVRLEELQSNLNIEDATKLIDHILYYKDNAEISVNTIFKHGI